MANVKSSIVLTFILGNKHLDVQRNVLVEIQFTYVERFDDRALVQQQQSSVTANLKLVIAGKTRRPIRKCIFDQEDKICLATTNRHAIKKIVCMFVNMADRKCVWCMGILKSNDGMRKATLPIVNQISNIFPPRTKKTDRVSACRHHLVEVAPMCAVCG